MTKNPMVSISMVTYNQEKFIAQAIESVLMQKVNFEYELVIGEDCSTDSTRDIVIGYKKKYSDKIKLILHEQNVGMQKNGSATLSACRGKYIALMEGDDYWTDPYKLQKQVNFLEVHSEYVICFHNATVLFDRPEKTIKLYSDFPWNGIDRNRDIYTIEDLIATPLCPTATVIFRKPTIFTLPDWYNNVPSGDMAIEIMLCGDGKIKYFDECWAMYRKHSDGTTAHHRGDWIHSGRIYMYLRINEHYQGRYVSSIKEVIKSHLKQLNTMNLLSVEDKSLISSMLSESNYSKKDSHLSLINTIKVAFVAYGPNQMNGPNIWLQRILPELAKRGFQLQVLFLMFSDKPCEVAQNLRLAGIKCITIQRQQHTEQNILKILNILKDDPPDIFVPNLSVPAYYAARWVKEAGIPTAGILHSDDTFHHELMEYFVSGLAEYRLSGIVCVSKFIEGLVKSNDVSDVEILRCSYGIDIPKDICRKPEERLNLVYTGRLIQRQKQIFDVINSLKNAVSEIQDTYATIYGEDREGGKCIEAIKNLNLWGKLQYGGLLKVEEIYPALLKQHVFVLLSDYEGMSISLMEAMGCGLVPICTKTRSGATEIIRHNENGLLVDNREDDFINAVKRLKYEKGLWEGLSKAARETVEKEYSIEVCADRWAGFLNKLAEQSKVKGIIRVPDINEINLPPLKISENGICREDQRMPRQQISTPAHQDSQSNNFLNPILNHDNMDLYLVRSGILKALKEFLPQCKGVFLDIGCGEMPYKPVILQNNKITIYIGMDIENPLYQKNCRPHLFWDGKRIPLDDSSVDCAMATELFEHLPDIEGVLKEVRRVLKPGGTLFFTVPFLWPLHDVPQDEYRYTPFSLRRHLERAGFQVAQLQALGEWDASLAQMIGLWIKRRPMSEENRRDFAANLYPFYQELLKYESQTKPLGYEDMFRESSMITGMYGTAHKPASLSAGISPGDPQHGTMVIVEDSFPVISETFIIDQITGLLDQHIPIEIWSLHRTNQRLVQDTVRQYDLMHRTNFLKLPPVTPQAQSDQWVRSFTSLNTLTLPRPEVTFHVHFGPTFNQLAPLFSVLTNKVIVSFHGYDASKYFHDHGDNCYAFLFSRADLITTPSDYMKHELIRRGCLAEKVIVHRYGVDTNKFSPDRRVAHAPQIRLLTIARLVEKKGIEFALRAFALVSDRAACYYTIIGEGPLSNTLQALVCELRLEGAVHFAGFQTNNQIQAEMARTDIFVLTSITAQDGDQEGVPVSLIEAQAMGLPVVSSLHAGIAELVTHEVTGLLARERDVTQIAVNMQLLVSNVELRHQFGAAGRKRIVADFDIEKLNRTLAGYASREVSAPSAGGQQISGAECPVCEGVFSAFLPFGVVPRPNALCPDCQALERHRLLWLYLQHKTNLFSGTPLRLLDIAPMPALTKRFKQMSQLDYISVDLRSPLAMRNMDITDLQFADDIFDCILCYHVLEHIPDDRKALTELYRVLKPGGWAIIQVPLKPGLATTIEDLSITEPQERLRLYGNADHVRYYGLDYRKRLEATGFTVTVDPFGRTLSESQTQRYGLRQEEMIYLSRKSIRSDKCEKIAAAKALSEKNRHELQYWEAQLKSEGTLSNKHYQHFYTDFWGIPKSYYDGKRVLDIGCGPRGSLEWADNTAETVGLDPLGAEYARLNAGKQRMQYVAAPSENIPYPDSYFDVVCSFNSLDHVDDLTTTIAEIKRVVKPCGMFLLLVDINHTPTACEPLTFSWDIVSYFEPSFELVFTGAWVRLADGIYQSLNQNLPYDMNRPDSPGVLAARFAKRSIPLFGQQPLTPDSHPDNRQPCPATDHSLISTMNSGIALTAAGEPFVSILIPTYNRGNYIADAIKSALAVSYQQCEVVVVDDGSIDNTAEVIRKFDNPKLRYIIKEHSGAPATRNRCIAEARGNFLLWLDSDDILEPETVSWYVALLRKLPDIDVLYGNIQATEINLKPIKQLIYPDWYQHNRELTAKLFCGNSVPNPGCMVRRSCYERYGTYNTDFPRAHDYEFWSRLAKTACFKHLNKFVVKWRWHDSNMSTETTNFDTRYDAMVLHGMLRMYSIQELFPTLPWVDNSSVHVQATAYLAISERLFNFKDYHGALTYAKQAYALSHEENMLKWLDKIRLAVEQEKPAEKSFRVIALISAYNEGDVIYHVIGNLIENGIEVYFIDNSSTDNTVTEAEKWLGKGLLHIEKFPDDANYAEENKSQYIWRDILKRKTELASQLDADWFIHSDADEFRESPWPGLTLKEAMHAVDRLGYSAIDFELLNFRPLDNSFVPGEDVRKFLKHYEGTEEYNALQVKAWKNLHLPIELVSSGGHDIVFDGRKIFPIKFILRHYPIRSQQHGILKVFHQRKNRFCAAERAIIWHVQYDNILDESHNFIHRAEELRMYDPIAVRRKLLGNGPYSRLDKFQDIAISNIHESDDEYRAAVTLAQAGKNSEAIEAFKALVSRYPNHALAHNDLGVLYTNMEDYEKALACSRLACQKQPPNHQFKKNLADLLYIAFKNTEEALPIYLELMKEMPNDVDVLTVLGRICTELSRLETAKTLYERIIELQPANDEARQSLSTLLNVQKEGKGDKHYLNICSIIIPVYNKVEYTKKCIDTIKKNTPQNLYEIIIVDNASTDETKSYLSSINDPSIKVITNKENLGFAKACNQGARAALTEYILFLNNDTEPQNGWIQPLIDILDNDSTVAAVGNKLLFPDGTIQHAGVMITDDRKQGIRLAAWHPYNRQQADILESNIPRTYQALTAACLFIRKKAFDSVHGFDESYWNGYEDVDLCFKLGKNNWRLVYQPASVVIHHESQSGPERFNKKDENLQLLQDRWIGIIEPDSVVYADGRAELTSTHMIQPYNTPSHTSDKTEIGQTHDQMGEIPEKPKIGFLSLDKHSFACPQIRLVSAMKFLDRQKLLDYIDLASEEHQQFEIEKLKQLDILIVQRNFAKAVPYEKLAALLGEKRPKIVYEFDDAFGHMDKGHIAYPYYQGMRKEIEGYIRNSDLVTVSTEMLKSYYKKLNKNIVVIPNFIDSEIWRMECKTTKRDDKIRLLFAGTIGHEPDLKIIEKALIKILNEYKDTVELLLWGNHSARLEKLSNVKVLAEFKADYSEYAEILKSADVDIALVPLEDTKFNQAKSHIKWIEYSSCAIPGIYSDVGEYPHSIKNGNTGIVANNSYSEWYQAIKQLITDEPLRNRIAQAAKEEVIAHHTVEQNATQWLQAYKDLFNASGKDSKMANAIYEPANIIPRKKFSIIIMTWNRAVMLDLCLKSLFKNLSSRDECEIIIGDNGSSDATAEVISRYQIDKYIRKNSNIGLELYHELFDLAQGEYLIELDDDVLDLPFGFEKKFEEYFAAFPDYGLIGLDVVQNEHTNGAKPDESAYREDVRGNLTIEEGVTGGWCLCLKRLTFEQIGKFGGLVLSMAQSEDGVLWKRVQAHGMRAGIIKDLKCFHASGTYYSQKYGYLERDIEKYTISGLALWNNRLHRKDEATASSSLVSIVVPLFNRIDFTKKCIAAIRKTVSKLIYELILVDNNSNDATAEYLKTLGNQVRVITNTTNLGFAKACNQGAKAAMGEYLLFLNNDTEPQHGWLEPLVDNLISDNSVAAAGSKLLYPDGTIQHAGIAIVDDRKNNDHLLAKNNHVGKPADAPEANIQTLHQALTAACILIRKSAFKKAGGFDEKYWNGYEDVDLCFKLQEQNGKLVYQPASVVIHHESQSGPERFAKAPENIKRLHKKWLGKIKPDAILNKDGTIKLTDAGKIRPYSAPGLPQNQLASKASTPALVSIVILTFNELKYTRQCLESIKKHTPEPHEIIFIDNASTDGTVKWLRKICQENQNYKVIENKINLGFAKGCNKGIEAASGEYILLLNNDVVVTENWLSGMIECLNSAPDVGIVGPMTNNISGPQKVLDADYKTIPGMIEYAKSFRERYRHRRIALRRIVGFCMLFRHALVDKIGLLDESFGTGNFEDDDYCLRATIAGCRNLIAGDVFIQHYGSRSFIGNRLDYGSSISGNIQIFDEKWMGIDVYTPLGKKFAAFNFIEKADTLNQKGQFDKAIAMFIEGIKYAPEEKIVYYRLAEMLLDAKLNKDALEAIESMPREAADDLKRLEITAYCAQEAEEAEKLADRALAVDTNYAPAFNLKGMNAYKRGDNNAAEDFFKKAIAFDSGYGAPFTNLGILKWAADKQEEALDWLEKGFILSPTLTDNVTLYHTAVTALEVFERAEKLFQDAKELHRENKKILFFLIDIYIKQGKYDKAMHEIEQAMLDIGIEDGMVSAALEIREKVGIKEIDKSAINKGTLSLCMIVKNEEQHLTRCLLSATPAVDEIIVVDTGSTDRTKEIARAFGAKVFDFPWTNDFSEARNVSLSKASGDWILVLDADEVISALDYPAIDKIVKKKAAKPVAYTLNTRNYTNEVCSKGWVANDRKYLKEEAGTGWSPSAKVRLFVNDKRIQFRNPVHEFVEASLEKAGIEIKPSDIPVHHYGRFDKDKIRAKGKEYFLLGKKKIEEMKGDIKAMKELAIQASELGEYSTAVEIWEKVIELNRNDSVAFLNIGYAYMKLDKYEEAHVSSCRAVELEPAMKEAALNYAGSELIIGDIKKTISILETLLRKNPDYPPAMALVAAAYYIDRKKEDGLGLFEKLRKRRFNCDELLDEQTRALMTHGKFDQAFLLLEAAVETGNITKDTKTLLAECHGKMKAEAR